MNNQQRIFDGSSIHGHNLTVYCKGDGVLSSSFVIERVGNPSCNWCVLYIFACIIVATVAVYWDLLSLTANSCFVWSFVLLLGVYLKVCYVNVVKESVLVVKDLGVQFTRCGSFGMQTSQFIEQHRIVDILINEVITMHQVVFYLMLLVSDGTQGSTLENNQQLLPLFTTSMPCLETIKPIYHGMQKILETI